MSIPQLIGPISTASSFMFASIQNGQPFILNTTQVTGGILYYWDSDLVDVASNQSMAIFTAKGTLDSLTIFDSNNQGGIAFRSDGITIGNAVVPATIKMFQPSFTNWFPPDIFLSAVEYTLFNQSGVTATVLTAIPGTGGTGPTIPANNIIILPINWYFNCTSSGQYDQVNEPTESLVNWFCTVNEAITGCTGIGIVPSGWTELSDCTIGNRFMYCATGTICGNNNCNGPCSTIEDDCSFSSGQYTCTFDINKFVNDTQWWESPYFIGVVIGSVFIVIVIIILIFVLATRT